MLALLMNQTDDRNFYTLLIGAVIGLLAGICLIGSSVYWSTLGVLMEASLWLPWDYQLDVPQFGELLHGIVFVWSAIVACRASSHLLLRLLPTAGNSPPVGFLESIKKTTDSNPEFIVWLLIGPLPAAAWRCLLVFIPLALMSFPYMEYQQHEQTQRAVVHQLDAWLTVRPSGGLMASEIINNRLLSDRGNPLPYLSCKKRPDDYLPIPRSQCTVGELRKVFEAERDKYVEAGARKKVLASGPYREPRVWLMFLIIAWLVGALLSSGIGKSRAGQND